MNYCVKKIKEKSLMINKIISGKIERQIKIFNSAT
jgi:hypothetical protein